MGIMTTVDKDIGKGFFSKTKWYAHSDFELFKVNVVYFIIYLKKLYVHAAIYAIYTICSTIYSDTNTLIPFTLFTFTLSNHLLNRSCNALKKFL